MSARTPRRSGLLALACLASALLALVLWAGARSAAGAAAGGELTAQPWFGAPASTFLGASPLEAPGEVWATAKRSPTLARYTETGGWETLLRPLSASGQPLPELELESGAAAGRATANGAVAVAATAAGRQILIVRDPGGQPREAPDPGAALEPEEAFFGASAAAGGGPLIAAIDAAGGRAGAFVVPGGEEAVLRFDGSGWSREEICAGLGPGPACEPPAPAFTVLGIGSQGGSAWLLGRGAGPEQGIELFRREAGAGTGGATVWRQQELGPAGSLGARFAEAAPLGVQVTPGGDGQPLTVAEAGAWVDAKLQSGGETFDATVYFDARKGEVTGSWCDLATPAGLCRFPLGVELPNGQNRSFAWPGGPGPYGERTVTGVGQGALLIFEGMQFGRYTVAGGDAGASQGAALSAPEEGWLGAEPPLQLTRNPEASKLQPWPVPFRRPLTAIAPQPGVSIGSLGSEALAVGDHGEVARYVPGQGWEPEFLLNSAGKRVEPTLRAVAWPEPDRAFAVGDEASMWIWRKATGLWQPDPAQPPNLASANFTGIAFDPTDPNRGYAVGKQGMLLGYGRQWTREALPAGVPPEANLTSVAFAGEEALATWKSPVERGGAAFYVGGVIINDGSGWKVDEGVERVLSGAVPERIAGLPDGGAVVASLGEGSASEGPWVIERQGPGAPWQPVAGQTLGYPAALAAVREGGLVRAVISIAGGQADQDLGADLEQVFDQPPPEQPPLLTDPYPLPGSGVIVRQTATGWRDEEHGSMPLPKHLEGQTAYDLPRRPDPVLALSVSPDGSEGWAVGGETGTFVGFQGDAVQTAGVFRYGAAAAPPANAAAAPLEAGSATANFAIGGNAQCAGPCADLAGTGIGPDAWLKAAVGKAAAAPGVRAFLYTGASVAEGQGAALGSLTFSREESAYARRLGAAAGALPVFAAPAASDLDGNGTLATYQAAFSGYGSPLGAGGSGLGISPISTMASGRSYYSFLSGGSAGSVRVIVLDYSQPALGSTQTCWLAEQLAAAQTAATPAIVVGQRDLAGLASNAAADAATVLPVLLGTQSIGCGTPASASAYFFDFPEENRAFQLSWAGRSIPAYGSGTLGYVEPPRKTETDFVGASGFLLAAVDAQHRDPGTNVAPVTAQLVPNIGSLAMEASDGTLIRRSHVALFAGLARRPLAGTLCGGGNAPVTCETAGPDPYVPIPSECQGLRCASGIFPEYTFTSSNPEVADFVAHDPRSLNPRIVLLKGEKPVADPRSGLLCAFNPGTTTVTVAAGGLSYSQQVTVLGGTPQRPCGTVPVRRSSAHSELPAPPLAPAEAPLPQNGDTPSPPPPPSPPSAPSPPSSPPTTLPAQPVHHPAAPAPPPQPLLTVPLPTPVTPLIAIVPPPPPPAFELTPPSGTAPVTQSAIEDEEEEEEAFDTVHHMAALDHGEGGRPLAMAAARAGGASGDLPRVVIPALVALLALVLGVVGVGSRGSGRRRACIAYQTTTPPRRLR